MPRIAPDYAKFPLDKARGLNHFPPLSKLSPRFLNGRGFATVKSNTYVAVLNDLPQERLDNHVGEVIWTKRPKRADDGCVRSRCRSILQPNG